MGFDYDQLKAKEGGDGGFWASYSDLFMVLSIVFLLLYVVSGLRAGANGIKQHLEFQRIKQENADYKEQIKAYNTLKDDYLAQGATQSEQETYEKLMDRLKLLKKEAKDEKDKLRMAAQENAEKEEALNQYQRIVRNIINTNMLSSARMKRKSKVITKIDKDLEQKKEEVKELNQVVAKKQNEIESKEKEIKKQNQELDKRVAQLKKAFREKKITQAMMQAKINKIKKKTTKSISALEAQKMDVEKELQNTVSHLQEAKEEIQNKDQTISQQSGQISQLQTEKNKTESKINQLKENFREDREQAQREFNEQLKYAQLSARERDAKIREFKNQLAEQKNDLDQKVAGLEEKLNQAEGEAQKAKGQAQAATEKARELAGEKAALSKDLAKAQAALAAKKELAKRISQNLKDAGVSADVDQKTGNVILNFGEEYFDTGSSNLKDNMKRILKRFMPTYSKSLLSDSKTADKIKSVKIVGFASPTYKGKYVDPSSLQESNREAASYNLNLSYKRAESIFKYIFNTDEMTYDYQRELLPLVEVSGRSYFAEGSEEDLKSMTQKEYCRKYDCKKAQRVVIEFDVEDR